MQRIGYQCLRKQKVEDERGVVYWQGRASRIAWAPRGCQKKQGTISGPPFDNLTHFPLLRHSLCFLGLGLVRDSSQMYLDVFRDRFGNEIWSSR